MNLKSRVQKYSSEYDPASRTILLGYYSESSTISNKTGGIIQKFRVGNAIVTANPRRLITLE